MANKSLSYRCLCLLVLALLATAYSRASAQVAAEPNRAQLLNGLTILYSARPGDANVLIKLRVHSGASFDLTGKAGMMALLGDAFFPDSETREYVTEQLGGRLEVTTSYDSIDVTISGKASEFERLIEMLRNAVITTNLSAENVVKLRDTRAKELSDRASSPSEIADRAVARRLFGSFPYANPPAGSIETLAKIERPDLMFARDRFLHPDNATLVVIGNVEKPRLMRAVRQLLGPWQKSDRTIPATFRPPAAPDPRALVISEPNTKSAEVRLAVRGLARSDRDAAAASLLAQIVRERWQSAVADLSSVFARHEAYGLPGMFVIGANAPTTSAGKAVLEAQAVMQSLARSGPNTAELDRARAAAVAQATSEASQIDSMASGWLDSETFKLSGPNSVTEINRLTAADLQRVAGRLFKETPEAIVVVGDSEQLKISLGPNLEIVPVQPEAQPSPQPLPPAKKP